MKFTGDLIGENVLVVDSRNKSLIGMNDKVVDETKNLIILDNLKKLQKNAVTLKAGEK